jgi:predicted RNA-binding protein
MSADSKYWVAVISKDHTQRGVSGGFVQACHGKSSPLKRMKKNDWIILYSPKQSMGGDIKCQAFTAIGQAIDDAVYQFEMTDSFHPFRRKIKFNDCHETSILPLIDKLDFIKNKKSWGYHFRFGFFEINGRDFNLIKSKMIINDNIRESVQL